MAARRVCGEGPTRAVRQLSLGIKLAPLDRAGGDPCELLREQRDRSGLLAAALADPVRATTGTEHTLALWRHKTISATMQFLDDVTR